MAESALYIQQSVGRIMQLITTNQYNYAAPNLHQPSLNAKPNDFARVAPASPDGDNLTVFTVTRLCCCFARHTSMRRVCTLNLATRDQHIMLSTPGMPGYVSDSHRRTAGFEQDPYFQNPLATGYPSGSMTSRVHVPPMPPGSASSSTNPVPASVLLFYFVSSVHRSFLWSLVPCRPCASSTTVLSDAIIRINSYQSRAQNFTNIHCIMLRNPKRRR